MFLWSQRKFDRKEINLPIGLDLGGGAGKRGMVRQTKDISPKGVFVLTPDKSKVGTRMFCRIILPSQKKISIPGTVWRMSPQGFALKFDREYLFLQTEINPNASVGRLSRNPMAQRNDPLLEGAVGGPVGEMTAFGHPFTDKTVLIVEHDPRIAQAMSNVLRHNGYRFRVEHSSSHGLIYFNENKDSIGLVIVDLSLPGIKPNTLVTLLKSTQPDVPLLLLSGSGQVESSYPHEAVLTKPFTDNQLMEEISSILFISRRLADHQQFQAIHHP